MTITYPYEFKRKNAYIHDNKFIFGSHDLSSHVAVEKITRTLIPAREVHTMKIPGRDGVVPVISEYGIRKIELDVRFVEEDYKTSLQKAQEVLIKLHSNVAEVLQLRDSNLFNYAFHVSSSNIENDYQTAKTRLTFMCYDPFNYDPVPVVMSVTADTLIQGSEATHVLHNPGYETVIDTMEIDVIDTSSDVKITIDSKSITVVPPLVVGKYFLVNGILRKGSINGDSVNSSLSLDSYTKLMVPNTTSAETIKVFSITAPENTTATATFYKRYL